MKVLLDENLPQKLRHGLGRHEVSTDKYLGWDGFKNGALLQAAEADGFDVLVTGDQSLRYQQNVSSRRTSVVILSAIQWELLKNHLPEIVEAIESSVAGSFWEVECGRYSMRRGENSGGSL